MPDISMCQNHNCKMKEDCYRYKVAPNDYWQSYTNFMYEIDNCFIPFKRSSQNSKIIRDIDLA